MSWDELAEDVAAAEKGTNDFFTCEDGDNTVRIVSEPLKRVSHYVEADKRSYRCTAKEMGICAYCSADNKPKKKYVFYIIDRADKNIKIAEFGMSVAGALDKFRVTKDYEFASVPAYDIIITKTGKGRDNTKYTVVAARSNTPITPEEQAAIDELRPLSEVIAAIEGKQDNSEAAAPTAPLVTPTAEEVPIEDLGIARLDT